MDAAVSSFTTYSEKDQEPSRYLIDGIGPAEGGTGRWYGVYRVQNTLLSMLTCLLCLSYHPWSQARYCITSGSSSIVIAVYIHDLESYTTRRWDSVSTAWTVIYIPILCLYISKRLVIRSPPCVCLKPLSASHSIHHREHDWYVRSTCPNPIGKTLFMTYSYIPDSVPPIQSIW